MVQSNVGTTNRDPISDDLTVSPVAGTAYADTLSDSLVDPLASTTPLGDALTSPDPADGQLDDGQDDDMIAGGRGDDILSGGQSAGRVLGPEAQGAATYIPNAIAGVPGASQMNPFNQNRHKETTETIDGLPIVGVDVEWGGMGPDQVDGEMDGGPVGSGDTTYNGMRGMEGDESSFDENGGSGGFDKIGQGTLLTDTNAEVHNAPGSTLSGGAGSMESSKTVEDGTSEVDQDGARGEIGSADKGMTAQDVNGGLDSDIGGANGSAGSIDKGQSVGHSSADVGRDKTSGEANDVKTNSGNAEDIKGSTDTPLGQGNAGADSASYKEVSAGNVAGEVGRGGANGSAEDVTGDYAKVDGASADTKAPIGQADVGADSAGFGHAHTDSVGGSADKDGLGMSTGGTETSGGHAENAGGGMETLGTGASGGADSVTINSQSSTSSNANVGSDGKAEVGVEDSERKTGDIDGAGGKLGKGDKSVQGKGSAEQGSSMESGSADVDATDGSGAVEIVGASQGGSVEDVTLGAGGEEITLPDAKASVDADADAEIDASDGTAGASLGLGETGAGVGPVGAQLGDIATVGADVDLGDGAVNVEIGGQELGLDLPVEDVTGAIGGTVDEVADALGIDPSQVTGPLGSVLTTAMGVGGEVAGEVGGAAMQTASTLTGPIRAMGGVATGQAMEGAMQLGGVAAEIGGALSGQAAKDAAQLGATAQEFGKNMGQHGEEAAAGAAAVASGDLSGLGMIAGAQAGLVVDAGKAALDITGQAGEAAFDNAKLIGTSLGNAGKDAAISAAGNARQLASAGVGEATQAASAISNMAGDGINTAGRWSASATSSATTGATVAGESVKKGAKKVGKSMKKYLKKLGDMFASKSKKRRKKRKARKRRRKEFRKKVSKANATHSHHQLVADNEARLAAELLASAKLNTVSLAAQRKSQALDVHQSLVTRQDENMLRIGEEQVARKEVATTAAIQATAPLEAAVAEHKMQLTGHLWAAHSAVQRETSRVSAHMTDDAETRSKQAAALAKGGGKSMTKGASKTAFQAADLSSDGNEALVEVVDDFIPAQGPLRQAMSIEAQRFGDDIDRSSIGFGRGMAKQATLDSMRLNRGSKTTAATLKAQRDDTISRAKALESTRNGATDAHVRALHAKLNRKETVIQHKSRKFVHAAGLSGDGAIRTAGQDGTTTVANTGDAMQQTITATATGKAGQMAATKDAHVQSLVSAKTNSDASYRGKRAKWKAYAKKKIG